MIAAPTLIQCFFSWPGLNKTL